MERVGRNFSFVALFPPRAEGSSPAQVTTKPWLSDLGEYTELGRSRLHTHSKKHVHSSSVKHQLEDCQRQRHSNSQNDQELHRQAVASNGVRDFWLFGEVVCPMNKIVTQFCSGYARERVLGFFFVFVFFRNSESILLGSD